MHRTLYVQELKQKLILQGHKLTPGVTDLIYLIAGRLVRAIMTFEKTFGTDDENLDWRRIGGRPEHHVRLEKETVVARQDEVEKV